MNFSRYVEPAYDRALYYPSNQEFALADVTQYQGEIDKCGNVFKSIGKGVKKFSKEVAKGAKKLSKGAKKRAKEIVHFVQEHKKEVLIVAGIAGVVVGGYFLVGALTGAAALDGTNKKREDEEDPKPQEPEPTPAPSDIPANDSLSLLASTAPTVPITAPPVNTSESDVSFAVKSPFESFVDSLGHGFNTSPTVTPSMSAPPSRFSHVLSSGSDPKRSCYIRTEGIKYRDIAIGFINGMNTSFEECKSHLYHLKKFTGDLSVEGVYNHSNSAGIDALEIFLVNYPGGAPVTGNLLVDNWTKFHEENKDNPDAKYLQFTHSMGTILTKNALEKAPQEIRDRVIVVAIGPAVIIPEEWCHKSFHYASENDIVHYGEDWYTQTVAGFADGIVESELLEQLAKNKERLILVEPHPGAKGINHDFESATFDDVIERHIKAHLMNNGQYR